MMQFTLRLEHKIIILIITIIISPGSIKGVLFIKIKNKLINVIFRTNSKPAQLTDALLFREECIGVYQALIFPKFITQLLKEVNTVLYFKKLYKEFISLFSSLLFPVCKICPFLCLFLISFSEST